MSVVKPFIWYVDNAEEAMNFYVQAFKKASIKHIERYSGDMNIPGEKELKGKVLTGIFEIYGQEFMCLDGGEQEWAKPSGRISILLELETQEEIDQAWNKLLEGGQAMQCGWLTDKFGVTWQITPKIMGDLMMKGDEAQKKAVMGAMMEMVKMEIQPLKDAFDGK